jgi:purine-binding chemotaxis protein CheW
MVPEPKNENRAIATTEDRTGNYLIFCLGDEEYGIGVEQVERIVDMRLITMIPQAPEFVKGVIKFRDKMIPVIDLRLRFGIKIRDHTIRSRIIIVKVQGRKKPVLMGIAVDSVSKILNINPAEIGDQPSGYFKYYRIQPERSRSNGGKRTASII